MKNFAEFGMKVPEILLPKESDLSIWSVIACDQYTQDAAYWDRVSQIVGQKPSTLHLTLPEIYLNAPDRQERVRRIRENMRQYLNGGVFADALEACIYVERKTGYGRLRRGLVTAIDLEDYEWQPGSKALIRATEATIPSRIPPRKEIRRGALLESPHIMLLVNDPSRSLVEGIGELVRQNAPVYDGELMLSAGHISGWAVQSEAALEKLSSALSSLKKANTAPDGSAFLFAVGDGNHSLATAKAVWDEYKAEHGVQDAALRYALVEIVNIYDEGLTFEPIHRVLFGAQRDELVAAVAAALGGTMQLCADAAALEQSVKDSAASFGFVSVEKGTVSYLRLDTPVTELAVSRLQPVLDAFIAEHPAVSIDYIHGSDEVFRLGKQEGAVSILLPPVAKDSFFATIGSRGPLPRKSFSMGEASEKRFYLECRRLD